MNVDLLHRMADADIDRFWSQVLIGSTDECWPWTGGCDDGGYGRFCALSTIFAAHQVASFLINGPPEESKPFVLHHCDNPPCCNGFCPMPPSGLISPGRASDRSISAIRIA